MINLTLTIWFSILGLIIMILLSSTTTILSNISGGTVRKLETRDKVAAEQLEQWLQKRRLIIIKIRLLIAILFILFIFCYPIWHQHCTQNQLSWTKQYLPYIIGITIYLFAVEWMGNNLSAQYYIKLLATIIPTVNITCLILLPITIILRQWHKFSEKWLDKHTEKQEIVTTEDEIMSLIEQTETTEHDKIELEEDEKRMIKGVLDLDETNVREIMTPRVDIDALEETTTITQLKQIILKSGHSRIPIYKDNIDQISGIAYAKDLLDETKLKNQNNITNILHTPIFIPETKNIGDLLTEFQQTNNHFAIVLDEYGGTAGIITFEDILEEIVGEIRDEYDSNEQQPTQKILADGKLEIDARLSINELNQLLDLELPENDEYDTIAGYITSLTGTIPQKGEIITTPQIKMEIRDATPRRITKICISKNNQPQKQND